MKDLLLVVVGIICIVLFSYGCYWIAKSVSYTVFYEDMVQETIKELVKASALKG